MRELARATFVTLRSLAASLIIFGLESEKVDSHVPWVKLMESAWGMLLIDVTIGFFYVAPVD